MLFLCLSFDTLPVVRNSSFDGWFRYGTTCSAFLMMRKRVSLRIETDKGEITGKREISMLVVLGISFARLIYKGAPQGPISAECT